MRTFKDNAGRTWSVSVDCDAIRRVRTVAQLNLADRNFGAVFNRLTGDPVFLCEVTYVLCKPEADLNGVSEADFLRAMSGDAIQHATIALLEELVNFIPDHRDRRRLQKQIGQVLSALDRKHDKEDQRAEEILVKFLDQSMAISGPSSGASPETSASTPAP